MKYVSNKTQKNFNQHNVLLGFNNINTRTYLIEFNNINTRT